MMKKWDGRVYRGEGEKKEKSRVYDWNRLLLNTLESSPVFSFGTNFKAVAGSLSNHDIRVHELI